MKLLVAKEKTRQQRLGSPEQPPSRSEDNALTTRPPRLHSSRVGEKLDKVLILNIELNLGRRGGPSGRVLISHLCGPGSELAP